MSHEGLRSASRYSCGIRLKKQQVDLLKAWSNAQFMLIGLWETLDTMEPEKEFCCQMLAPPSVPFPGTPREEGDFREILRKKPPGSSPVSPDFRADDKFLRRSQMCNSHGTLPDHTAALVLQGFGSKIKLCKYSKHTARFYIARFFIC